MLGNKFKRKNSLHELTPYDPVTKEFSLQTRWLDHETRDLLGMKSDIGLFQDKTEVLYKGEYWMSLAALNDVGMPLREIAQVIREKWEVL
jgi:hypothetical protein